ncbi:MAG: YIP1 family protein [Deltaproteobacteria bacterium]|nr:YIP1 family protein [Deltaproteobacteria bacterium]
MTVALTCPYCSFSKKVPKEKIPTGARWATCPRCQRRFKITSSMEGADFIIGETQPESQQQGSSAESEKKSLRKGAPWEHRAELGLWQAIYQTVKEVLFSPDKLFSTLHYNGGIGEPLAFGLLTGSIGAMFSVFWQFLMLSGGLLFIGDAITGQFTVGLIFLVLIVFVPIAVIIGMFASSAICHLFLFLLKGANNGFEATFSVISYSQSAQLWGFIPFVGGWVSFIWQLIVLIVGLREIHETSYLKVIFAFLIPVAIIVFLAFAAIILMIIFLGQQQFNQLWS